MVVDVLGCCAPDSLLLVLSFLSARDILNFGKCSHEWHRFSSSELVWRDQCHRLWQNKIHNAHFSQQFAFKSVYFRSVLLSHCDILSLTEVSKFLWSFRFKEEAGEDWTEQCPWHAGHHASISSLLSSGAIRSYRQQSVDPITAEAIIDSLTASPDYNHCYDNELLGSLCIQRHLEGVRSWRLEWQRMDRSLSVLLRKLSQLVRLIPRELYNESLSSLLSSMERDLLGITSLEQLESLTVKQMKSTFRKFHSTRYGNSIRVRFHNVPVPLYICHRSSNWGYVLQSCWAVFTSWKMPLRQSCPELEDDNLLITVDVQSKEVDNYNKFIVTVEEAG